MDWTQDVINTGQTDSQTNREEAEGLWRMSAAVNMLLPEALAEDFGVVMTFMSDLSQWGRNTLAGIRDLGRYHELHAEYGDALNKLEGAMRADLRV